MIIRTEVKERDSGVMYLVVTISESGTIRAVACNAFTAEMMTTVGKWCYTDYEAETVASALLYARMGGYELTDYQLAFMEEHLGESFVADDEEDAEDEEDNTGQSVVASYAMEHRSGEGTATIDYGRGCVEIKGDYEGTISLRGIEYTVEELEAVLRRAKVPESKKSWWSFSWLRPDKTLSVNTDPITLRPAPPAPMPTAKNPGTKITGMSLSDRGVPCQTSKR